MPDPLDSLARLITLPPVVGDPRSTVTLGQSQALMGTAMDQQSKILQYWDRIDTFQQKAESRAAGSQVIAGLQQLDPRDPEYLTKRNALLSSQPAATLDAMAVNFLGLQEDLYRATEAERQRKEDMEFRGRMLQVRSAEEEAEDERDFLTTKLPELSDIAQTAYATAREQGMSHAEAMIVSGRVDKNETEILTLLEEGFTEQEVEGMLNPETGFIDARKRAAALGKRKRETASQKEKEELERAERRGLEDALADLIAQERAMTSGDQALLNPNPEGLAEIRKAMADIRSRLGYPTPGETMGPGALAPVNPVTGKPLQTPSPSSPASDPAGKYFK